MEQLNDPTKNNQFIYNLLNPPTEMRIGQIWHIAEYSYDVVVTDIAHAKDGIVRVSVISPDEKLGDNYDFKIEPANLVDANIYMYPKRVIRMTDCAILSSELKFYKSSLTDDAVAKMLAMLSNTDFQYTDEFTFVLVNSLVSSMAPYRRKALAFIESK